MPAKQEKRQGISVCRRGSEEEKKKKRERETVGFSSCGRRKGTHQAEGAILGPQQVGQQPRQGGLVPPAPAGLVEEGGHGQVDVGGEAQEETQGERQQATYRQFLLTQVQQKRR